MSRRYLFIAFGALAISGCSNKGASTPEVPIYEPIQPVHILSSEEKSLFPMKQGNVWNYSAEEEDTLNGNTTNSTTDLDLKMTSVRVEGQTHHAEIVVTSSNTVNEVQRWDLNEKGLLQLSTRHRVTVDVLDRQGKPILQPRKDKQGKAVLDNQGKPVLDKVTEHPVKQINYDPPQPFLVFPTEQNESITWVGSGAMADGEIGTSVTYIRILKPQVTDIDEGSVTALPTESHGYFKTRNGLGYFNSTVWFQPRVGIVRIVQYVRQGGLQQKITVRLRSANVGEAG